MCTPGSFDALKKETFLERIYKLNEIKTHDEAKNMIYYYKMNSY